MKHRFGLAFALIISGMVSFSTPIFAQCTVPNALANGQVADASQVMENFAAVAECSDTLSGAAVTTSGAPATGSIAVFSGPKIVTTGNLTGDVTTSGGTASTLASTGVVPGTYTAANIVVDAKGRITSAASGPVGSGGGGWSMIYSNAAIPNPTNGIVVDVSSYSDIMVIGRRVTSATSGFRGVLISVDNGANFFKASGDYEYIGTSGSTVANFIGLNHSTATTAARAFGGSMYGLRIPAGPKFMQNLVGNENRYFVASGSPITHIKITVVSSSGGADINMTGGEVYVYGR